MRFVLAAEFFTRRSRSLESQPRKPKQSEQQCESDYGTHSKVCDEQEIERESERDPESLETMNQKTTMVKVEEVNK